MTLGAASSSRQGWHVFPTALHGFKADELLAALVPGRSTFEVRFLMIVFTRCMVCMNAHRESAQGAEAGVLLNRSRELAI